MTLDMQAYRAARAKATDAAEAIRAALAALDVPESVWSTVRPMVSHQGRPYVHLGMMRADVVAKIAEAMERCSAEGAAFQ
ncbi:hypothetical protein [Streptomyces griseosporeus]|uniref:hypothetical protein n=1 Tax=Streptomyces griseosporeus TaxID=1910 RepID=UPI0036C19AB8